MDCSRCNECYIEEDYMYCSKYRKYVYTHSQCIEMAERTENEQK